MPRVSFPISIFTDSGGNPLAFGSITIQLNTDALTPTPAQLCAKLISTIILDSGGSTGGGYLFWPNADLNPLGTVYVLNSYTASGEQVLYNESVTV